MNGLNDDTRLYLMNIYWVKWNYLINDFFKCIHYQKKNQIQSMLSFNKLRIIIAERACNVRLWKSALCDVTKGSAASN